MASPYDVSNDILLRAFGLNMNRQGSMIRVRDQKPRQGDFAPRNQDGSKLRGLPGLPTEVTDLISQYLDIRSLDAFRATCFTFHQRVREFSPYRDILQYSPDTVRVLKETELSSHFTYVQLYKVLKSDRCENCDSYGPFLFLLTCRRCCLLCTKYSYVFQVVRQPKAAELMDHVNDLLNINARLPMEPLVMKSIPGRYRNSPHPNSDLLISWHQVHKLITDAINNYIDELYSNLEHDSRLSDRFYDQDALAVLRDRRTSVLTKIRELSSCSCMIASSEWIDLYWRASVPFPSLNQAITEHGLSCGACDEAYWTIPIIRGLSERRCTRFERANAYGNQFWDAKCYSRKDVDEWIIDCWCRCRTHYTKAELLQHFKECDKLKCIQNGHVVSRLQHRYVRELFSALPFHKDETSND